MITNYLIGNIQVVKGKNKGYGLPADVWSLGCTVLEMLTGEIPYSNLECVCLILFLFLFPLPLVRVFASAEVFAFCSLVNNY
jgi:serine/threonine protein kinase